MVNTNRYKPLLLFEDNHLVAVSKPAGWLVQRDEVGSPSVEEWLKELIKGRDHKPGNVYLAALHRLDRPVAGVVLFAKTSKAASRVAAEFRARRVFKSYFALVQGSPPRRSGVLNHHLVRDGRRRKTLCVTPDTPGSQEAVLNYRLVEMAEWFESPLEAPPGTLLEIIPHTGRSHQIRAQLAALGCPLLGDTKYGAKAALPARNIALFARRLEFSHPITALKVVIETAPGRGWPWVVID